jgi:hypothetical protein
MHLDNPAVWECPKGYQKLHTWKRRKDGTAYCRKCDVQLTVAQTREVFTGECTGFHTEEQSNSVPHAPQFGIRGGESRMPSQWRK